MQIRQERKYVIEPDMPEQTKWLLQVMNFAGISMTEFGEKLHLSKQSVSKLVHRYSELSFTQIVAICAIFRTNDDAEEIWRRIQNGYDR